MFSSRCVDAQLLTDCVVFTATGHLLRDLLSFQSEDAQHLTHCVDFNHRALILNKIYFPLRVWIRGNLHRVQNICSQGADAHHLTDRIHVVLLKTQGDIRANCQKLSLNL